MQAQASFQDLNDALGFDEQVNDVPEAPINMLIAIFTLVASFLGVYKLKNK